MRRACHNDETTLQNIIKYETSSQRKYCSHIGMREHVLQSLRDDQDSLFRSCVSTLNSALDSKKSALRIATEEEERARQVCLPLNLSYLFL
jgi:hypothetical protein